MTETDYRLWAALALSTISLIWNVLNRWHANDIAQKLRKESIRLEEFRSTVKDPLKGAIAACEEVAQTAEALATSGKPLLDLKDDISGLNSQTILALNTLENRLIDANQSRFADGTDWLDEFETSQDTIYQKLDLAANENRKDQERQRALSEVKTAINTLRKTMNDRIEAQIEKLASPVQ